MNKEQLLQKADELIAHANILNSKANELKELANKEDSNIILVPNNIQLSIAWSAIAIHNWRHRLYYASWFWSWVIWSNLWNKLIKSKLIKCKWEDIKVGDLFYRDETSNPKFYDLIWYGIKLKDWYQFWDIQDCNQSDSEYKNYWKVVQI